MENPWRATAIHPSTEVNFVKSTMVDREGVIMCPNDVNMFGVPSKFHNYRTQGKQRNYVEHGVLDLTSSLTGLNNGGKNGNIVTATSTFDDIWTSNAINNAYRNYNHLWNPTTDSTDVWQGSAASGNCRASTWTNCIDNTYVTWPATIRPVPKILMQEK